MKCNRLDTNVAVEVLVADDNCATPLVGFASRSRCWDVVRVAVDDGVDDDCRKMADVGGGIVVAVGWRITDIDGLLHGRFVRNCDCCWSGFAINTRHRTYDINTQAYFSLRDACRVHDYERSAIRRMAAEMPSKRLCSAVSDVLCEHNEFLLLILREWCLDEWVRPTIANRLRSSMDDEA